MGNGTLLHLFVPDWDITYLYHFFNKLNVTINVSDWRAYRRQRICRFMDGRKSLEGWKICFEPSPFIVVRTSWSSPRRGLWVIIQCLIILHSRLCSLNRSRGSVIYILYSILYHSADQHVGPFPFHAPQINQIIDPITDSSYKDIWVGTAKVRTGVLLIFNTFSFYILKCSN